MNTNEFQPVIGLEVHIELKTDSKMFCGCKNDPFSAREPNIYTCPVCLGLPGALPVPNKKAVEWCIRLGLALHCSVLPESKFDRKNYFYPDLPKGYQISQYDKPFCENGWVEIQGRKIRIRRVHQEEDTGKLLHVTQGDERMTLVDFNRSGVPLVEVVTEPDFYSIEEVDQFVKHIQRIVRYLDISNADMEKGSLRLEPSISLRSNSSKSLPGYRVELKNINSFRFLRRAIEFEVKRQGKLLENGEQPVQQTRGWSESKNETLAQREKEEAHDYRYFPEPDIPPFRFTKKFVERIRKSIPVLPEQMAGRLRAYNLSSQDVAILIESKDLAQYFIDTATLAATDASFKIITPKQIANVLINTHVDYRKISSRDFLASLVTQKQANDIDRTTLTKTVEVVLSTNGKAVEDYKRGKTEVLMFLVGQVKRELKGKGDAETIKRELKKFIKL